MTETKFQTKPDYTHILVGVDRADDAQLAFAYAVKRAIQDNAKLTITSVLEDDELNVYEALSKTHLEHARQELVQQVKQYVKQARDAGVARVESLIGEGDPDDVILKEIIPTVQPDLVIIGAETRKGLTRHFGSNAASIAKYAPVSVLIVR